MLYFSRRLETAIKNTVSDGRERLECMQCEMKPVCCKRKVVESGLTCQSEGVDILAVVCACHVLLSKADGVFALGDAVEDL